MAAFAILHCTTTTFAERCQTSPVSASISYSGVTTRRGAAYEPCSWEPPASTLDRPIAPCLPDGLDRHLHRSSPKSRQMKRYHTPSKEIPGRIAHSVRRHIASIKDPTSATLAGAAINRLPPEVLIHILELCVFGSWQRHFLLEPLRRVCAAWTSLIDTTPSFWSFVSSLDPEEFYLRSLARSKDHPLQIVYYDAGRTRHPSFFSAACENACRWSSFTFTVLEYGTVSDCADMFKTLEGLTVPWLQKIEMEAHHWHQVTDILGGKAPLLRSLSLGGVRIPWESGLLRNLQVLSLSYPSGNCPSARDTLHILTNCPTLVDLRLAYPRSSASAITDHTSQRVQLTSLTSIRLNLDHRTLGYLLKRLEAPNCSRFFCDTEATHAQGVLIFSLQTEHISPVIIRCVQSSRWQQLDIDSAGSQFEYGARSEPGDSNTYLLRIKMKDKTSERTSIK